MKFVKVLSIIFGILMVIGGLYCLFYPDVTYLTIGYVIGVCMLIDAVGRFVAWWQLRKEGAADAWLLVGAVLSLVFGVILVSEAAAQYAVDVFIAYMAAIWILVMAIVSVIRAFRMRRMHKTFNTVFLGKNWWIGMLIGILMCIFAILSLMNPEIIMVAIGTFIGLGIVMMGASIISFGANLKTT